MKTKLLPHQIEAVEKLRKLKVGALFMEQGTGKTRTALELFRIRKNSNKAEKLIWLCPCSVKQNLKADILKHAADEKTILESVTICGIETLSSSMRANAYLLEKAKKNKCMLIVDESLLVKNPRAYRTKNIIKLASQCPYRLILNGTPIGKNEADLFAQFYILDWRILGYSSYWSFAANHLELDDHGKIVRCFNVEYLTKKIAPYVYQVKKNECLTLPDKKYSREYFYLTDDQYEHYRDCIDVFLSDEVLDNDAPDCYLYRAFTVLQEVASGRRVQLQVKKAIHHESFFDTPEKNPRIQILLDELQKYRKDEKIVIWTKFQHEIEDIYKVLQKYKYEVSLFHGGITMRQRIKNLEKFQSNSNILLANKNCAGFGLNLQFCNNAIYYNNDWSYSTKVQSEDRLHRLGQKREVNLTDITAAYTIDERILNCLDKKENIIDCLKQQIKDRQSLKKWLGGEKNDPYWIEDLSEN